MSGLAEFQACLKTAQLAEGLIADLCDPSKIGLQSLADLVNYVPAAT